jgi:hypothetical protein
MKQQPWQSSNRRKKKTEVFRTADGPMGQAPQGQADAFDFRGESTMNLTALIDQTDGFQNGRAWAVYEKKYRTPLIRPDSFLALMPASVYT